MNTCDICGGTFSPGARILWRRVAGEKVGFSATHIVCPRLLRGLAVGVAVVVSALLLLLLLVLG